MFNEIKPKNGKIYDLRTLNIEGYDLYVNNIDDALTRGVCIYVNSSYKSSEVIVKDHKFKDVVSVSVTVARRKNILVQCIYRSGTVKTATANDPDMHELISKTAKLNGYTLKVIAGDFNLNKIKWSPDPSNPTVIPPTGASSPEEKFLECIRDAYFTQHVTEPTRFRKDNQPTGDDLVFSTLETDISDVVVADGMGRSDHATIKCCINTEPPDIPKKKTIYLYDKGNYSKMNEMLKLNWDELLSNKSIDEAVTLLEDKYHEAVKSCIPSKVILPNKRRKPLWMNKDALVKVKKKYSSWIRYLNTKQGQDYAEYCRHRNKAAFAIRKAQKDFELAIAKDVRKNPKGVWNYMKSSQKMRSRIPNLKKSDKTLTETDEEIAEVLNKQYCSVFTNENLHNLPNFDLKQLITQCLSNIEVSETEVEKLLKNLPPRKASGLDGIQPSVLSKLSSVLAKPLKIIYQHSIDEGVFPKTWLQAGVVPVFKKGSRSDPANYRPVSLTSVLCKVLEKIVVKHIIKHVKANNHYSKNQHGFTPKRSITTNLLEVLNRWTEALMHDIPIDIIYMDYAKAFDTVPHCRLIKQVETFGISGKVLKWIEAFLTDRQQKVLVNGAESSWAHVKSGIPQGSILGPVLFTLFVNDIPDKIKTYISLYADDTKIYCPLTSDEAAIDLAEDLAYLQQWARDMQMQFHPNKCKVMHLGSNNPKFNYYMYDNFTDTTCTQHTLEKTLLEKDLGVYVDKDLDFTMHTIAKVNKAHQLLGYVRHTFKHLNKQSLPMLYKSIIRPHLEFASCIWSPKHRININRIEAIQRRATKCVPELRHLNYEQRLANLKLETLSYRRMRADLIEAYRIINNLHEMDTNCGCSKCPEKSMLSINPCRSTRGNSKKIQLQHTSKERLHFFENRIVKFWNNLSESAVSSKNVTIFKNHIDKELGHLKYNADFLY